MCGRYAFFAPREAIARAFGVEDPPHLEPRYNLAPTQYVPALRIDAEGRLAVHMLYWGLVPYWARDPAIGNRMINARAETLESKPAFREAFEHRRCVLLASGFYEWCKGPGTSVPHFVARADGTPFAMAGLWERWQPRDGSEREPLESCVIITTDANRAVAPIHDRMPAILSPEAVSAWLDPEERDPQRLRALLAPFEGGPMRAQVIGRSVNDPRNEGPELIQPALDQAEPEGQQQSLF